MRVLWGAIGCLLILCACAAPRSDEPHPFEPYLDRHELRLPDPDHFHHCSAYGCARRSDTSLSKREWARVTAPFKNIRNAEAERRALAESIARFEQIVGEKTGTSGDLAGTFSKIGDGQLDCIDESLNTTTYMAMLQKRNVLKYHRVSAPVSRTPLTALAGGSFWPHQTAVVFEKDTGLFWAVDSWFRDNGHPADIVLLSAWTYGWSPDDLNIAEAQ